MLFDLSTRYLEALWNLLSELWIYFVIGFLVAGFIAEFVPSRILLRYLGRNNLKTFLRSTLAGLVASLCSCGAIPIAVALRKGGATRAAALTFMLAAPWAGFMQLVIFYKFLGMSGTAIVFAGALSVAFLSGIVLGYLEDQGWLEGKTKVDDSAKKGNLILQENLACKGQGFPLSFLKRVLQSLLKAKEAFLELWKYLGFGLLLAGALKAFVPTEWIASFLGPEAPFNPVFVAVPLAAAVELCSEGFSIFAGQLHQMGATLAVVFVVVLVGVATDFTELSVIWGKFGKRSAAAYLITATMLTLIFGLLIQQIFQ